ncbi:MAG: DNA integrity scanning protein DisA nucleotide-binding domain protein [Candidatus Borkfalkiaceae bacterium]|nr:DNA integrity scanning protein DisA nucleotide-binding domain protein [Clostridia bacterium]MDY6222999.1 DNA integrity scanning protein DisA nucleotide-binding domain protein [Christensenellaceae bacterium]
MAALLLAEETGFLAWAKAAGDFFVNFKAVYAVEIILLFLLMTYVSKTLKENDATRMMLAYWVLIVCVGAAAYGIDFLSAQFYLYFLLILSVFMLIIFNVEIKKSLWDSQVNRENLPDTVFQKESAPGTDSAERCIGDIIRALQNMSKNNVGALIILSKGNMPKQVLQSGVKMDADISTQLIEGVFFPKAPLHDGAMIIKGHKIQAAGCFLPLTQKTNYPKDFGTRHRAGIGITEVANVVSLVVSEETGIISIIKQGNVQRYADYDMLLSALRDYYWQELPLADKKTRGATK